MQFGNIENTANLRISNNYFGCSYYNFKYILALQYVCFKEIDIRNNSVTVRLACCEEGSRPSNQVLYQVGTTNRLA